MNHYNKYKKGEIIIMEYTQKEHDFLFKALITRIDNHGGAAEVEDIVTLYWMVISYFDRTTFTDAEIDILQQHLDDAQAARDQKNMINTEDASTTEE